MLKPAFFRSYSRLGITRVGMNVNKLFGKPGGCSRHSETAEARAPAQMLEFAVAAAGSALGTRGMLKLGP